MINDFAEVYWLQKTQFVVGQLVLLACIAAGMTASCILFVLYGPVPVKRKVTIVPRHSPPDVFAAQPVIRPSQLTPRRRRDRACRVPPTWREPAGTSADSFRPAVRRPPGIARPRPTRCRPFACLASPAIPIRFSSTAASA